jgi:hypothetical protein
VPAGHYLVFAEVQVFKGHAETPVTCVLSAGPPGQLVDQGQAASSVDGMFFASLALEGQADVGLGGVVVLSCGSVDLETNIANVRLTAIAVDAVN